ncbi:MAG: hypothetical protein ACM3X4_04775 [Ignavibacteriales bacterium]
MKACLGPGVSKKGPAAAIVAVLVVTAFLSGVLAGCTVRPAAPGAPAGPQAPAGGGSPGGGQPEQGDQPAQPGTAPETPAGSPGGSPAGQGVEFKETLSYEIEGELWTINFKETMSPDGRWVLATQTDTAGVKMVALPLDGAAGDPRILHSADRAWTSNNVFGYYSLGWLSGTQCLFATQGWQNTGPHKGQRGVAIFAGDVAKDPASVEEVGFIALPDGSLNSGILIPERKKAYLHVPRTIWEFDAANNRLRQVKSDLPSYDGLFFPKPSPDGRYYVYDIREDDAYGIYLLDTETGQQRPLLPAGETMSFYPFWSPDGKYIAAYTVYKKQGAKATQPGQAIDWADYDILEGEDGPQSASDAITVVDLDGKVAHTIKVEGKKLSTFRWGPGSNAIGFLTGNVGTAGGGVEQVIHDGVWLAPSGDALKDGAAGEPLMAAAVERSEPGEDVYITIGAVDADGGGVLYTEYRTDKILTRHARLESSKAPETMEAGFEGWGMEYVSGDPMVGAVSNPQWSAVYVFEPRGWRELVRFGPNRQTLVLGYNGDVLAVTNNPFWNPYMAKPGAEPEKAIIKAFKVIKANAK